MAGPARRNRAYRLRDAAPDRMSAADWPGQNSSPEAETSRQDAAANSRQTTLSAAMAPAATNFRLARPAPEERLFASRKASPVATATQRGSRCARASRPPELGCRRGQCWGGAGAGRSLSAITPPRSLRVLGSASRAARFDLRVCTAVLGLTRYLLSSRTSGIPVTGCCMVPWFGRSWPIIGTGPAGP